MAERVRIAEEMKKLTDVDGGFATRVTLTSSQSFNYPSRGKAESELLFPQTMIQLPELVTHCTIHTRLHRVLVVGTGNLTLTQLN